jgi:hypothetical protein
VPRDDKAVPSVIAVAREHKDPRVREALDHTARRLGDLAAGVLHKGDARHAERLDTITVERPHLVSRGNRWQRHGCLLR